MNTYKSKPDSIGKNGELEAKKYLQKIGFEILCLNYCNYSGRRIGEIDIIAKNKHSGEIVFVEVKSRILKNNQQSPAEDSINHSKLHKLNKIANFYISKNNLWDKNYRFDAIAVYFKEDKTLISIKHLQNIFL